VTIEQAGADARFGMLSFARSGRSAHTAAPKPRHSPAAASHATLHRAPELRRAPCACGGGCPRCRGETGVGSKLKINEPGDIHEREADRIAGAVVGGSGATAQASAKPMPSLQRQAEHQAAPQAAPPIVHDVLNTSGRPLDAATRAFMEPRFGLDFGAVRVHADARAAQSAAAVGAAAYTVGRDVVFGEGQFAPASAGGRHLLAHELAHVVQQEEAPSTLKLMRTITYDPDCAPRQDEVSGNIERAQASAARWARGAVDALNRPDDVGGLLRRHFNVSANDRASVTRIKNVFELVAGQLDSDAFTYHCRPASDQQCQQPDGETYAGFAYAGQFGIFFCDGFPYQDFFGHKSLIDTLLHEAMHAHDAAFNHDSYEYHSNYPGPAPLTNADSYASFARDASLGVGLLSLDFSAGATLTAAEPQFYLALGTSFDLGGPRADLFNLRAGIRLGLTPGVGDQPTRVIGIGDIGVRINPIRARVYVDLATGAYLSANFGNNDIPAGIASRVSAGYRGERIDFGLEANHFKDLVGNDDLLIIGVRGAYRFR
jgi:hypothetical protein